MSTIREKAADMRYAQIAKRYGMQNSLRTLWEARAVGITPSLALAILEQESGGKNVFGHDPTSSIPAAWKGGKVTRSRYRYYKSRRGRYGMQGVGPMQLTWWEFQDGADRLGGCWRTKYNIRFGMRHLAALIRQHGLWEGVERYNGTGPAAERYRRQVYEKYQRWHRRLT